MNGEELSNLADGLAQNELLQYDYILTGYIGVSAIPSLQCIIKLL